MKVKTYHIGFFRASVGPDGRRGAICDRLLAAKDEHLMARAIVAGPTHLQVRGITPLPDSSGIQGYIVRFRDDTPLTGAPTDPVETPIDLGDGKGIVERNHFILYKERPDLEILAYQSALEGTHISGLSRYLTLLFGAEDVVHFDDILNIDAYQALSSGALIKSVDFRIAKPRSKRFAPDPEDTWTKEGLEFMQATGATSFEVKISTRLHGKGLLANIGPRIKRLLASQQTRKLKVKMSDIEEPIDLLAERVSQTIQITLVAGAAPSAAVHDAMRSAKMKVQPQLDAYFGQGDEILE